MLPSNLAWPVILPVTLQSHVVNDVVFSFPRSGRELWADSRVLNQCSPYLKLELESGFREGTTSTQPFVASEPASLVDEALSEDSDPESDKLPCQLATSRTKRSLPAGVREIVIQSAAYTTYHAALVWIITGYINFAPLSVVSISAGVLVRSAAASSPSDSELPFPASAKSVYQLAHLLELPDLMKLALDNFQSQLTVENVLYQVVSDIAVHDEVFDATVAFAKPKWQAIKDTQAAVELGKPEVLQAVGLEGMGRLYELARRC